MLTQNTPVLRPVDHDDLLSFRCGVAGAPGGNAWQDFHVNANGAPVVYGIHVVEPLTFVQNRLSPAGRPVYELVCQIGLHVRNDTPVTTLREIGLGLRVSGLGRKFLRIILTGTVSTATHDANQRAVAGFRHVIDPEFVKTWGRIDGVEIGV